MLKILTVKQIQEASGGLVISGEGSVRIQGFSTDSRTLQKGEAFIAINGEHFDGHAFIDQAVKKGARALIVSKKIPILENIPVIRVKDTTHALGRIAAFYRRLFDIPVIAVTGSAGKTTTKEMIAAVLSARFKVLKNAKTENNQYGVPLTILKLNESHEAAVLELGTNQPGDIPWLTSIAQPTIAVFTNIGESHLQGLGTPRGVFREKFRLVEGMAPGGIVIYNKDDRYLRAMPLKKTGQRMVSYAVKQTADHQANGIRRGSDHSMCFQMGRRKFVLNTPVEQYVYNALAAISCARVLRINDGQIQSILLNFEFGASRQEIRKAGEVLIIDDTYNANPVSFKSAIGTLDALKTAGQKILVAGDMMELGQRAQDLHLALGEMIARSTVDAALMTGKYVRYAARALRASNPRIEVFCYGSLPELHRRLLTVCRQGDLVLVKGSRAMRMERTVAFIEGHWGDKH